MFQYSNALHFRCNDLRRWKLTFGRWFSVRLHHWVRGDPEQYQHSHPWNFITIVLWGGYDDVGDGRPCDRVRAPTIRYRPRTWRHSVIDTLPNTWTIVITGRMLGRWRFWIRENEVDESTWGLRPCE